MGWENGADVLYQLLTHASQANHIQRPWLRRWTPSLLGMLTTR